MKFDLVRDCFYSHSRAKGEDINIQSRWREAILKELKVQLLVARGHDRNRHPILYKGTRTSEYCNEEGLIMANVYSTDRCCAISEILTRGEHQHITAVTDYKYRRSGDDVVDSLCQTPSSLSTNSRIPLKKIMQCVRAVGQLYPERFTLKILLDPSSWIRSFHKMSCACFQKETMHQLMIVDLSGDPKQQVAKLSEIIDAEQAMERYYPGGKLKGEINLEQYLCNTPFHCLYDGEVERNAINI